MSSKSVLDSLWITPAHWNATNAAASSMGIVVPAQSRLSNQAKPLQGSKRGSENGLTRSRIDDIRGLRGQQGSPSWLVIVSRGALRKGRMELHQEPSPSEPPDRVKLAHELQIRNRPSYSRFGAPHPASDDRPPNDRTRGPWALRSYRLHDHLSADLRAAPLAWRDEAVGLCIAGHDNDLGVMMEKFNPPGSVCDFWLRMQPSRRSSWPRVPGLERVPGGSNLSTQMPMKGYRQSAKELR
jgi:hypothetical protein